MTNNNWNDGSDRTIIRPTPGQAPQAPQGAERTVLQQPGQPSQPYAPAGGAPNFGGPIGNTPDHIYSKGINPLVDEASELLTIMGSLRHAQRHDQVGKLHQQLIIAMKAFDQNAKENGVRNEIVLSARYALCAVIDELVLSTPWGAESQWSQKTLLSVFHNETSGGEKFFLILERMMQQPSEFIDMLELQYLCLSLGFEGKYKVHQQGSYKVEEIRQSLYRVIRQHRGDIEHALSPRVLEHLLGKGQLKDFFPFWVVAALVGAVLVIVFSVFQYALHDTTAPVTQELQEMIDHEMGKPAVNGRDAKGETGQ